MILFIDTEWADILASELVSLALVSDCGRYEFYAERDPLPETPTDFVRSVVYPLLDRGSRALADDQFTASLHKFFDDVLEVAPRGKVLVAYDHRNDMALLEYALDGFESPETPSRPPFSRFNLGLLGDEYLQMVESCFARDTSLTARRHHALIDARVNRQAYLEMRDREAWALSEFERIRSEDPKLEKLMLETFGNMQLAAKWWTRRSLRLANQTPGEKYRAGGRGEVVQELYAIRYGMP